ncbi:hypothetical protein A6770_27610 [Nostoc minutum NIES-26]|uniref:Microcin J25-processing protein McjB C-terminal domain-containing protein n=1 Tax=Nostoc minutum NIES-26 TaxID=1844469 RepID=A0A367QQF4_9NOSO|nr:hypothetical protein A6770_27610 [Nostoc minutum NIES-26]
MRRMRNFLRLSAGDRYFLIKTLILLAAIRLGLWLLRFSTLLKILNRINQQGQISHRVSISKIVWAVNAATRYVPGAKCLARALATQVLMNRHSYSPELRIGVTKGETGKLEAHAWIEYQGRVVIGNLQNLSRYMPLPSLEGVKL